MTYDEIKKFVAENIQYKDWEFHVKRKPEVWDDQGDPRTIYLQVQFITPDSNCEGCKSKRCHGCGRERQYCRKWQLSEWMTETEIVRTAFLAVRQAEIHECEERFLFMGQAIYSPHIDVEELRNVSMRHDKRK